MPFPKTGSSSKKSLAMRDFSSIISDGLSRREPHFPSLDLTAMNSMFLRGCNQSSLIRA